MSAKYQLHCEHIGKRTIYYLSDNIRSVFIKLYPTHTNTEMSRLFGASVDVVRRIGMSLGLVKDMAVLRRKIVKNVMKTCRENGYYESLRGKPLSAECYAGRKRKEAEGWHPFHQMRESNPRKYKRICKKILEKRKDIERQERWRISLGIPQHTKMYLPTAPFTESQMGYRKRMLNHGYILGDRNELYGERYTIYYDKMTSRSEKMEKRAKVYGFVIKELKE